MAEASAETTATTEAPAASGGMPQFDFAVWPGQIAWALVIFVGLYLVLSKGLLPKVKAAIEAREGKIKGDMDEARRLRDEAQAQAEAAAREIAEARVRAARTATDAKSKAAEDSKARQQALEAELNQKIGAAEAAIAKSRDAAMANVRSIASDTAAAITEKLTGQAPEPADLDAAITAVSPAN